MTEQILSSVYLCTLSCADCCAHSHTFLEHIISVSQFNEMLFVQWRTKINYILKHEVNRNCYVRIVQPILVQNVYMHEEILESAGRNRFSGSFSWWSFCSVFFFRHRDYTITLNHHYWWQLVLFIISIY